MGPGLHSQLSPWTASFRHPHLLMWCAPKCLAGGAVHREDLSLFRGGWNMGPLYCPEQRVASFPLFYRPATPDVNPLLFPRCL